MRVDAYNQIAQVYGTQKASKTQKSQGVASGRDQFLISQTGHDYHVAKKAVSEASDVREDKVTQLKSKISSGEYQVEPDDFATKLLAKYNETMM